MPRKGIYSRLQPYIPYRVFPKAEKKINTELIRRTKLNGHRYTKQDIANLMLEEFVVTEGLAANTVVKKRWKWIIK